MKLLLENFRQYQSGPKPSYVSIDLVLPTEELGHGKDHDCPSKECDDIIKDKVAQIMSGKFEPILVCNQKPLNVARLSGTKMAPKNPLEGPFYYVLDGHHRLEAAKQIGLRRIPVIQSEEANT